MTLRSHPGKDRDRHSGCGPAAGPPRSAVVTTHSTGRRGRALRRLGTPRDTAHLVDFLCSERGQWVNGQLLLSNGGFA